MLSLASIPAINLPSNGNQAITLQQVKFSTKADLASVPKACLSETGAHLSPLHADTDLLKVCQETGAAKFNSIGNRSTTKLLLVEDTPEGARRLTIFSPFSNMLPDYLIPCAWATIKPSQLLEGLKAGSLQVQTKLKKLLINLSTIADQILIKANAVLS